MGVFDFYWQILIAFSDAIQINYKHHIKYYLLVLNFTLGIYLKS